MNINFINKARTLFFIAPLLLSITGYSDHIILPKKKPKDINQIQKENEEKALYSDFPSDDGIINQILSVANIPVTPKEVHDRNLKAENALNKVLEGLEGKYVGYFINKSECVAWINLYRISFMAGSRTGRGVVSCRINKGGNTWGAPLNIFIGGISGGPQIGLDQVNYFLFFPSKETLLRVIEEFTIKTDLNLGATLAKWGTSASVGTDIVVSEGEIQDDAIYSYGDSKGVYLGLSLEGALLFAEDRYNIRSYGEISNENILSMSLKNAPNAIRGFTNRLNKFSKDPGPSLAEILQDKAKDAVSTVANEAKDAITQGIKDSVSTSINNVINDEDKK